MHKIVFLTDCPEGAEPLISCLNILFPECEIRVEPKHTAVLQGASLFLESSIDEK
jgi:hypothetical protein